MPEGIVITVLVENTVYRRGLMAEHGLAVHIQAGKRGLLFDTGQTDLLLRNANELGIDLARTETIVLSHGHDDHTGGLAAVLRAAPNSRVLVHPSALLPKFTRNPDGTARSIGMSEATAQFLQRQGNRLSRITQPTEVLEGIFVTGGIPRPNQFEDNGGDFFLDSTCLRPDPLTDDQALFFDTDTGLVALLGCAHAGVVNTIDYIKSLASGRPVRAIVGGLHLGSATPERLKETLACLQRLDIQQLAPGHCTGLAAASQLCAAFPTGYRPCSVGFRLQFRR